MNKRLNPEPTPLEESYGITEDSDILFLPARLLKLRNKSKGFAGAHLSTQPYSTM